MSYSAIVTTIATRPHPNADNIQLGTVIGGNQVVIGKDVVDGERGVFFPCDGALSHEFCAANHLYNSNTAAALDVIYPEGTKAGFFSENRRVRAQRFRGEKSDGFWVPLSYFYGIGYGYETASKLKVGDTFTEFDGVLICEKYFTPATLRAMKGGTKKTRTETKCFPKHIDTMQFRHYDINQLPPDSVIYITEKVHGTSGRFGLVMDEVKLPTWKRLINWFVGHRYAPFPTQTYRYLNGSRNVILEKTIGEGFYGTNAFRYEAVEEVAPLLHKGEIIYFELVGYISGTETKIMPDHDNAGLKDKEIVKTYGPKMSYLYGCIPGQMKLFVYKITQVNEDGVEFELAWNQVVARCDQLGLETVPLLTGPKTCMEMSIQWSTEDAGAALARNVDIYTEGPSLLSPAHIREGVVVRIESSKGITYVKNKSFVFKVLEGILKEDDTLIDIEEAS